MSSRSLYSQLQLFAMIARAGSIRAAARETGLSAPSVSAALKQLETALGLPLFVRTTRSMDLTDAGRMLLERTAAPMDDLALAVESVQDLAKTPTGRLAITLPRFVYQWVLRDRLAEFSNRYPLITLELSLDDAEVDLAGAGFDAGFRLGHRVRDDMVARQLTPPQRDAYFASPAYLEQHGVPRKPGDLVSHRFIYYRFITSRQLAQAKLQSRGRELIIDVPARMVVNDTDVVLDSCVAGQGIGKLLEPMAAPYFADGRLVPILERYWPQLPGLYVYFPQRSQLARRVRVFIDFLVEALADDGSDS